MTKQTNLRILMFLFLVSLLVIPLINGAKTVISSGASEGALTLYCPVQDYYPLNSNISFYVHVYNASYYLVSNNIKCDIHFYDNLNKDIGEKTLIKIGNEFSSYFDMTNETNDFSYLLSCNSSTVGGVYSNSFRITVNGTHETPSTMIAAIILVPLILSFLFIFASYSLGQEHTILKIFLFLLSMIPYFTSLHFGTVALIKFYNFPELQNAIGSSVWWFGLMIFVIISYFMIYAFYKMMETARQNKKERIEY